MTKVTTIEDLSKIVNKLAWLLHERSYFVYARVESNNTYSFVVSPMTRKGVLLQILFLNNRWEIEVFDKGYRLITDVITNWVNDTLNSSNNSES